MADNNNNNNGGAAGDDQDATSNSSGKGKKQYQRHTNQQIEHLELFFNGCPHPDENQRRQLGKDLGLEPKEIKFWFQNRRTQAKAQTERTDNSVLRAENERVHCENIALKEALKNVVRPTCGGPPLGDEEWQKLQFENAKLKEEVQSITVSSPVDLNMAACSRGL